MSIKPKFRAYDIETHKMWQWEDHNAFTTDRGSIKDWFTDHDLKIMQFTGVYSNDSKEVYFGDIIKASIPEEMQDLFGNKKTVFGEVVQSERSLTAYVDGVGLHALEDIVIVGNIYDSVSHYE